MKQVLANKLLSFDKNIEHPIPRKGIEDIWAYLDYNDSYHKLPERTEDPCPSAGKNRSSLTGQDKTKKSILGSTDPFLA